MTDEPIIDRSIKKITTKKIKKPKVQKRSVVEFKMWITGMCDFQDENWIPNSDQWDLIKNSIYAIKEETVTTQVIAENTKQEKKIYQPIVQSSLDSVVNQVQSVPPVQHLDFRNKSSITTDIDTSDGNYKSDFE